MLRNAKSDAVKSLPAAPAHVVLGSDSFFGPVGTVTVDIEGAEATAPVSPTPRIDAPDFLASIASQAITRAGRMHNSTKARIDAGLAYLAAGRLTEARAVFTSVLEQRPGDRRANLALARTAKEEGLHEESVAILMNLFQSDPTDIEVRVSLALALLGSDVAAALEYLRYEPGDEPSAATLFATRGAIALGHGHHAAAIRDLRQAIRMRPDWVYARNALGLAEAKAGRLANAEKRFREATRLAPLYPEPLVNLARVLARDNRWSEILDNIERYWTVASAPLEVACHAASACLELDNARAAKAWLTTAETKTRTDDEAAFVQNNLGVALERLGKLEEAARGFQRAVALSPTDISISNFAKVLLDLDKPEEAVAWLEAKSRETSISGPAMVSTLASALAQSGDPAKAVEVGRSLLQQPAPAAEAYRLMSGLYADWVGDITAAIETAKVGLSKFSEDVGLMNNLAYSLLLAGMSDEAEAVLDTAESLTIKSHERPYLTATRGLLAFTRGDVASGWALYEQASAITSRASTRERVRVKRDLETARALIRKGADTGEISRLLHRAAAGPRIARPYSLQAQAELRRLSAGSREATNA